MQSSATSIFKIGMVEETPSCSVIKSQLQNKHRHQSHVFQHLLLQVLDSKWFKATKPPCLRASCAALLRMISLTDGNHSSRAALEKAWT